MARQRFLLIWVLFASVYTALAVVGPDGLLKTGVWPFVNQHLLQVRAWRGEDILLPAGPDGAERSIELGPRLDVTPYFRHRVVDDPREEVLLANLAVAVRGEEADGALEPIRYLPEGSAEAQFQLDRMVCHVGSPLGPSMLMLPLRMLLGTALATQWFGALLGGLAVALIDLLLLWWLEAVHGPGTVSNRERSSLVVLAGLGTLWFWLAPQGAMWQFAQTTATCALTLALVLAWRRRWLSAGAAFGVAIISRPPTLLAFPILLAVLIYRSRSAGAGLVGGRRSRRRALLQAALLPLLLGGAQMTLNALRFGSVADFGYRFMLSPPEVRQRYESYGALHPVFFRTNARYLLLQPPVPVTDPDTGEAVFPWLVSDPHGMGILFVTPAFMAILMTLHRRWRVRGLVAACWASLILVATPALLYFNTGWIQWGGRYLLDGWPLWLMLAALGLRRVGRTPSLVLIAASVASNLWAAILLAAGWWP